MRHQRVQRRRGERSSGPYNRPYYTELVEVGFSQGEHEGQAGNRQAPGHISPEQERPPGKTVRDGPAYQQQGDLGGRGGDADVGK